MSTKLKQIIGFIIWALLTVQVVSLCYSWMRGDYLFFGIFIIVFWSVVTGRTKAFTKKPIVRDYVKFFKGEKEGSK